MKNNDAMLDNCYYNKIKLLHELSTMLWFLKKHGIDDAKKTGDKECIDFCNQLAQNIADHITLLQDLL